MRVLQFANYLGKAALQHKQLNELAICADSKGLMKKLNQFIKGLRVIGVI